MKGQRLSIILTVQSFLYPMGWVFLEEDGHFTWYHCLMHNSTVERWHLKSMANTSVLNILPWILSLQELLPASPSNAHLNTWLTEWQSRDSGLFVTGNCLRRWKERLEGSRVRAAHICKVLLGVRKRVGVFWKVSAVRNGYDEGADNTVIWPVSDSWHSTHNYKAIAVGRRTVWLFVYRSEPLPWGQLVLSSYCAGFDTAL